MIRLQKYKVKKLEELLQKRNLPITGNKADLIARLEEALKTEQKDSAGADSGKLSATSTDEESEQFFTIADKEIFDTGAVTKQDKSIAVTPVPTKAEPTNMEAVLQALLGQMQQLRAEQNEKLDQQNVKFDQQNVKFDQQNAQLKQLRAEQGTSFEQQNEKLEQQNIKFDQLRAEQNEKLEKQNEKFDQLRAEQNDKFEQQNQKLEQQNEKFDQFRTEQNVKFDQLGDNVSKLNTEIDQIRDAQAELRDEMEAKIKEIEARFEHFSSKSGESGQNTSQVIIRESAAGSSRGLLKPPTFDGETPFENFKVQFQAAVLHNGWTDGEQVNALILALRGKAADVLQAVSPTEKNCKGILTELELRYGQSHVQELCKIQLHNKRQGRGESLQDLEREITKLARQAYAKVPADILNGLTVDAFINAVRDDHLKLHLRTNSKGKTMNEVLASALEYEAARASLHTDSIKLRKLEAEDIAQIKTLIKEAIGTPPYRNNGIRRPRYRGICFRCQKRGHYSRDCTEPATQQTIVQPERHEKRTEGVRQIVAQNNDKGPRVTVLIAQLGKDNSSLVINGILEQEQCTFTLDTGACRSVVRPDMVHNGKIENIVRYNLRTATGDAAAVKGECTLLVKFGGISFKHRFIVANITDECILGLDFMKEHQMTLDLKTQVLKWSNIEVPFQMSSNNKHSEIRVITEERVEIPPMSEKIIYATVDGDPGCKAVTIVEPTRNIGNGILCGRTLVKIQPRIPVRVMNVSQSLNVIKKGAVIGKAEEVNYIAKCEQYKQNMEPLHPERKRIIRSLCKHLTLAQSQEAERALEEFADVFAINDDDVGMTDIVQHRIDTGNATPIRQAPRRLPLAKQRETEQLINKMERDGVIEQSSSPWSSPVVLVQKKDGSTRFCVDYRKLNEVTKKDSYPLPRIDDTLDTLAGAKIFSTLDLKSGYWQVKIHPEDKEKTAFTTGTGLYQFLVMPFGLCNAPATFERLMEHVLRGLNWKTCLVYLDDIIVIGRTFQEHVNNLREVLQTIKTAGLKLSSSKCSLFKSEVDYLGHIVSADGVRTDPKKLAAVEEWPTPKNLHELRSFLGLCSYYRRFVPNFADVARSLHHLTEKNTPFGWTQEHQAAFAELKKRLCTSPILAYPRAGELFILDTDASKSGIGAILSQKQEGKERVVAYYSRALSKAEKNYCVTRRELLAVVDSVKHFHKYLYGQEFLLRTDHAALKWLMQFKEPEGQVARWIERLQAYTFRTEHRKGILHNNADGMSRRPCAAHCKQCARTEEKDNGAKISRIRMQVEDRWTNEELSEEQARDPSLRAIKEWLKKGVRPEWQDIAAESPTVKSYWAQWQSLSLKDGVITRLWESADGKSNKQQLVLPASRIKEVMQEMHNGRSGSHLGINKTLDKVRDRFYWVNYRRDVEEWCRQCEVCAASKGPQTRTRGKMQRYIVGAPFERIAMDIVGPFPETDNGNRYILVCIDYFSKWVEAYPLKNQEARTVADAFVNNWICRFGVPLELHSDQGRNFESAVFQELCEILNIKKTRTTPLHPQSDGMVERFNRTLEQHLRREVNVNQDNWDSCIPLFLMGYRSATHDTTGNSPAMVIFGRELRLPCDMRFGCTNDEPVSKHEYVAKLRERMNEVHNAVRDNMINATDRMKTRYDVRANSGGFAEGDLVWLYNPARRKGKSPKLQNSWEGPYKVIKRINDVVYRIQHSPRSKMKVVHMDRLTKYNRSESVRDEQN